MNDSTDANEEQVGGNHYRNDKGLQHWDVVQIFGLDYFQGNITKYVFRHKKKGGIEDLKKAQHYLKKYIQILEKEAAGQRAGIGASLSPDIELRTVKIDDALLSGETCPGCGVTLGEQHLGLCPYLHRVGVL